LRLNTVCGCIFDLISRETAVQDEAATMSDAVGAHPPDNTVTSSDNPSSEEAQLFSKPSLSYIALIAKVILSSPSQKLNLASIYRAMEEQFPYLRSRGPGWRNSVRHNLSVNDCFVKVSRCEDGRGHHWGVHQAHLRDFQQGNFRQYRKARGRREKEPYDKVAGCLAWMESSCFLGKLCKSRSLGWVEPRLAVQISYYSVSSHNKHVIVLLINRSAYLPSHLGSVTRSNIMMFTIG
uniref:Fork-head domain-containing protein n=1 Tax=Seriola lalandi dorsalis TaxID=1841481 RepID=A0A3B4WAL1_SERLL